MGQSKLLNTYSLLLVIAISAISAYLWGWQSFVIIPDETFVNRAERCKELTFSTSDATQRVGYPFTLAERELDCGITAEESYTGYGDYSFKPLGLIADIAIWTASTASIAYAVCKLYYALLKRREG